MSVLPATNLPSIALSSLINSPLTTTTGAAIRAAPVAISPARGLFVVIITDVAAGSTMYVTIQGGETRKFGDPKNAYHIVGGSALNNNITITNYGTLAGATSTLNFTDTTTTSTYELVYDASSTGDVATRPTIENPGGALPAGNVTIRTVYFNSAPPFYM